MADVKALQTRLATSLGAVGYKKNVPTLPASHLERNEGLRHFLEQTIDHVRQDNHLSPEQLQCYEDVRSAGKVLEGQVLEDALRKLSDDQPTGDIEKEVADMRERTASLRKQLQTLNSVQKSLSDHYASLLHKRDELTRQKSDMLKHHHSAQQRAEGSNRKLDGAVEDLMGAVRDLCTFHRRDQGGRTQTTPPRFLSKVAQDAYHQSEDQYLSQLTTYTKKQFFKGLVDVAHSRAPGEEGAKFAEVDLDNSDQVMLMGVTEEQHRQHCQELSRLQALYPLTEVQYINSQMARAHAEAATSRARQELEALSHMQTDGLRCDALRQQYAERQQRIDRLRRKVQELGHAQLTTLLQDMAALQVTRVLHGDYDLKLARQDYFSSKQDKVISHLQSQQSRQELLSMLYEVELRKHRDTHRLLSTAEKQLTQLKEEGEKRGVAMQSQTLKRVDTPRLSVDSSDTLSNRLCTVLGVKWSSGAAVLTHASLEKAVEQLAHQLATLQGILATNETEMKQHCQNRHSLAAEFERELFGHHGEVVGQPRLTVEEYSQQCSQLTSMVTTLEHNIKALLKDYDAKKKLLQANPLLERERKLFVHFFTEPDRLSQTVSDLAKRVDSIALANK